MKAPARVAGLTVLASRAFAGEARAVPRVNTAAVATERCSVDLVVGRKLRMRVHRIEPGEATLLEGGPSVSYVTKGTVRSADRVLHAGDGLAEGKDTAPLRLLNDSSEPAEFVTADIVRP